MNRLSTERRAAILHCLLEGGSVRATERLTGTHRDTVLRLMVDAGRHCRELLDRHLRELTCPFIEADEIWTFVQKKERRLTTRDNGAVRGDQYLFIALDPGSKLIVAHEVGKRDYPTTERFLRQIRDRLAHPFELQFFTDGFLEYPEAIRLVFADLIDHAQVIGPKRDPDEMAEYGEGLKGKGLRINKRLGLPDDEKIGTSYVERCNGTVRQQMRRFTRKTQGFSKKLENLRLAVDLFVAHYNLVRPHRSLKGATPAMAAGVSETYWEMEDLMPAAPVPAVIPF